MRRIMEIVIIGSIFLIYIIHHAIITLTFKNSNKEKRKREKLDIVEFTVYLFNSSSTNQPENIEIENG